MGTSVPDCQTEVLDFGQARGKNQRESRNRGESEGGKAKRNKTRMRGGEAEASDLKRDGNFGVNENVESFQAH